MFTIYYRPTFDTNGARTLSNNRGVAREIRDTDESRSERN